MTSDEIEEDEVPETQETVFTKLGDLFIMGNHRLLCGDSTKIEDVNRLLGGSRLIYILRIRRIMWRMLARQKTH